MKKGGSKPGWYTWGWSRPILIGTFVHWVVLDIPSGAHAVATGVSLREAMLGQPELRQRLGDAGLTLEQVDSALDPAGYLGAAGQFTDAALAAHARQSAG